MLKRLILVTFLLVASCSQKQGVLYCPNVIITPEYSHVTNFFGNQPHYRAELVGYEGYCRYNPKTNQTIAMISPIFEIARLSNVGGRKINISYYANTSYNQNKNSVLICAEDQDEKRLLTE